MPADRDKPLFRHQRTTPDSLPPGPGRRYDASHFRTMAIVEKVVFTLLGTLIVWWLLVDFRILPDWLGWQT